jgi:hypothetical protein
MEFPPHWSTTADVTGSAGFSGSPQPITTPAITTTHTGDLIIAYAGSFLSSATCGSGTGYLFAGTNGGSDAMCQEYAIAGANGSITATMPNKNIGSGTTMIVALPPLALAITSPATIPDGVKSQTYSYQLNGVGGTGTYTWAITAGALQSGLSLNASTGVISGTPTTSSVTSVTVQITDGSSATATKSINLTIGGTANTASVVQSKQSSNSATVVYASNVTAGNLLFIAKTFTSNSGTTGIVNYPTDSLGTVYTLVGSSAQLSSDPSGVGLIAWLHIYIGVAPSSGANTVTIGTPANGAVIAELANVQNFPDNAIFNAGTSAASNSTITSGTLTTLTTNEVLLSMADGYSPTTTLTANSPFTPIGSAVINAGGYEVVTTVAGYTVSYTQSGNTDKNWVLGLAGFRPTAGPVAASKIRHSVTGGM